MAQLDGELDIIGIVDIIVDDDAGCVNTVGKLVGKPDGKLDGEPVNEPVGEPVNEPDGEPVNEPDGKPVNEPDGVAVDGSTTGVLLGDRFSPTKSPTKVQKNAITTQTGTFNKFAIASFKKVAPVPIWDSPAVNDNIEYIIIKKNTKKNTIIKNVFVYFSRILNGIVDAYFEL